MTHLLGTGSSSPHHWEYRPGEVPVPEIFPSTFLRHGKKQWTPIWHDSNILENIWGFLFFIFFPPFCGILVPFRKSLVAKWRFMTWKMGKKDKPRLQHWHKSTTGLKYFTPQGLFSPDVLTHLNKGTSGAAAAWLWLKDQRVDWPRTCLFGRAQICSLFAQQAFSALWESSHMAIFPARWRWNATMSVRSLRSRLLQAALSTAPLCLSV